MYGIARLVCCLGDPSPQRGPLIEEGQQASLNLKSEGGKSMEFHPLANMFPLMEGSAFDELVEDIRQNGQRDALVIYEHKILDGRNRYRACEILGIEPKVRLLNGDGDPLKFVASANIHRRHLSPTERAAIASNLENGSWGRQKIEDANLHLQKTPTRNEAAAMMNVSSRSVAAAAYIRKHGTALDIEEMTSGKRKIYRIAERVSKRVRRMEAAPKKRGPKTILRGQSVERYIDKFITAVTITNQACINLGSLKTPRMSVETEREVVEQLKLAKHEIEVVIDNLGGMADG